MNDHHVQLSKNTVKACALEETTSKLLSNNCEYVKLTSAEAEGLVFKRYAISDDYNAIYPRKAVKSTKTTGNTRVSNG